MTIRPGMIILPALSGAEGSERLSRAQPRGRQSIEESDPVGKDLSSHPAGPGGTLR